MSPQGKNSPNTFCFLFLLCWGLNQSPMKCRQVLHWIIAPAFLFFLAGGVGVGSMCYVTQLEFAIFLPPSLNMKIPHLCSHTWDVFLLSPWSLHPPRRVSVYPISLSVQKFEIPSVLRRISFSFSGIKGKLGPAPGVPDLRHWLWPLSSGLPVPPGSTWWSLSHLIPPQSFSVLPHRPLWPLVTWTADKGSKRRDNTFRKKGRSVRLSYRHSLCFFFSFFPPFNEKPK